MEKTKVAVLGSTGSIGKNVLQVAKHLDDVSIIGISVNKDIQEFKSQLKNIKPEFGIVADNVSCQEFLNLHKNDISTKILSGTEGINKLVQSDNIDVVVNGLSGIAGLRPTILALKSGKKVATANKESIVMGWHLIKDNIQYEDQLIPVDSEHSAIFQALKGERIDDVAKIVLTASGGAVYNKSYEELENITTEECLSHPTWSMGHKITIDSATLMNKGLEVIEAHNLFSIDYKDINIYIHPQSIIHGMIEYIDGTVMACLATQDMKIPIQYALTHPKRKNSPSRILSIEDISRLEFYQPDTEKFPCLDIAIEAGRQGGIMPIIMCAADEAAVESFTKGEIKFTEIPEIINRVLERKITGSIESVEEIEMLYMEAKKISHEIMDLYLR